MLYVCYVQSALFAHYWGIGATTYRIMSRVTYYCVLFYHRSAYLSGKLCHLNCHCPFPVSVRPIPLL